MKGKLKAKVKIPTSTSRKAPTVRRPRWHTFYELRMGIYCQCAAIFQKGDAALDMSYLAMDKALTRNEPGVACDVLEEVSVL